MKTGDELVEERLLSGGGPSCTLRDYQDCESNIGFRCDQVLTAPQPITENDDDRSKSAPSSRIPFRGTLWRTSGRRSEPIGGVKRLPY